MIKKIYHALKMHASADRTFALCPCHVDDGIFVLWIAKFFHQRVHAVEVEFSFGDFEGMFGAIIYE